MPQWCLRIWAPRGLPWNVWGVCASLERAVPSSRPTGEPDWSVGGGETMCCTVHTELLAVTKGTVYSHTQSYKGVETVIYPLNRFFFNHGQVLLPNKKVRMM